MIFVYSIIVKLALLLPKVMIWDKLHLQDWAVVRLLYNVNAKCEETKFKNVLFISISCL